MIKKLVITNFQNHEKSRLDFCDGVNVITGSSDQGKSAIIRALMWLIFNKPRGSGFKRAQAGSKDAVSVKAVFDGKAIARRKTSTKNTYKVAGETYAALKTDVPDEIVEMLAMSEHSVQGQFERHFFFQDTPGERARKLNKVANLDSIDKTLSGVERIVRKSGSDLQIAKEELEEREGMLGKYGWLDVAETKLSIAKSCIKKIEQLERIIASIQDIKEELAELSVKAKRKSIIKKKEKLIAKLEDAVDQIIELGDRKELLLDILEEIKELTNEKKALKKSIRDKESEVERLLIESGTCPVCGKAT